jgi:hypothetical protein
MEFPFESNHSCGRSEQDDFVQPSQQHQSYAGFESILTPFLALVVMAEVVSILQPFAGHQPPITAWTLAAAAQSTWHLINRDHLTAILLDGKGNLIFYSHRYTYPFASTKYPE